MDRVKRNAFNVQKARRRNAFDVQKARRRNAFDVQEVQSGFKAELPTFSAAAATSSTPLLSEEKSMVGFDCVFLQLFDMLIGEPSTRKVIPGMGRIGKAALATYFKDLPVIPIVGMGGIGKTTLATNAFQHSYILQYFDDFLWTTISQQYSVHTILTELLSCLRKSTSGTVDELGLELHKSLYGRRYLIILDDMWSVDAWDEIKFFFPRGNGSRIVVTSRNSDVAHHLNHWPLQMSFLDEDSSWDLFCQKAFAEQVCPPELEEIGKKIVEKCQGLPLAIVMVGGYLRKFSRMLVYWENVANHMNSIWNSAENETCLNVLSLSDSHLPAHLKLCFLFMGAFPEDQEISMSEILKLWDVEGFIEPCECHILEDVANVYLGNLNEVCKLSVDLLRVLKKGNFQQANLRCLKVDLDHKSRRSLYLPSSISLLWNLQTLIITGDYVSITVAPYEIWEMLQLRHIEVDLICLLDPLPVDDFDQGNDLVLRNLHTLLKVENFRLSEEVCKRIPNIKELQVSYRDFGEFCDEPISYYCPHNLGCFHELECLVCQFDCNSKWRDFALSFTFPSSLKCLSLCGSHLLWEEMTMMVGSLPHLVSLQLHPNSVIGSVWTPAEGKFIRLKSLEIYGCDDLIYWNADDSHFPVLEKLHLDNLSKLDEFPLGIGEIPTLESIVLDSCSMNSTFSAMRIVMEQEQGNEDFQLKVYVRGDEQTLESFNKKVQEFLEKKEINRKVQEEGLGRSYNLILHLQNVKTKTGKTNVKTKTRKKNVKRKGFSFF